MQGIIRIDTHAPPGLCLMSYVCNRHACASRSVSYVLCLCLMSVSYCCVLCLCLMSVSLLRIDTHAPPGLCLMSYVCNRHACASRSVSYVLCLCLMSVSYVCVLCLSLLRIDTHAPPGLCLMSVSLKGSYVAGVYGMRP